ncbi:MAG: DUF5671 domain-containing protein [bacterium]|nr:DUF5671 domain-containing protein [bacterium]
MIKATPKDVFINLLAIISLYASAISLMALLFQYVNLGFPDPLAYESYSGISGSIRWAMATLIIVFPVFLFMTRMLRREVAVDPSKKELPIRKWLVYFTLFITAIVITTDLVTLIYNFLGGELTARFILKVLIILFVSVKVFGYYLWDLKEKFTPFLLKLSAWGASVAILVSVVAVFFTVASPLRARDYRFDEQRIGDLQTIQWQIINYWTQKGTLPKTLPDLDDDISGFAAPIDPATKDPYGYRLIDGLTFELCGVFTLPSVGFSTGLEITKPSVYREPFADNWNHDEGAVCFERSIDPELYRKNPIPVSAQ